MDKAAKLEELSDLDLLKGITVRCMKESLYQDPYEAATPAVANPGAHLEHLMSNPSAGGFQTGTELQEGIINAPVIQGGKKRARQEQQDAEDPQRSSAARSASQKLRRLEAELMSPTRRQTRSVSKKFKDLQQGQPCVGSASAPQGVAGPDTAGNSKARQ